MSVDNERNYGPYEHRQPSPARGTFTPATPPIAAPYAAQSTPPWGTPGSGPPMPPWLTVDGPHDPASSPVRRRTGRRAAVVAVALLVVLALAAAWALWRNRPDPGVKACGIIAGHMVNKAVPGEPDLATSRAQIGGSRYADIRISGMQVVDDIAADDGSDGAGIVAVLTIPGDYNRFAAACSTHGVSMPSFSQIGN